MTKNSIVYMGWLGYNNFGDDLLFESWRSALGDELAIQAPLRNRDYIKQFPKFLKGRLSLLGRRRILLLGGGTVLGFKAWAEHVHLAQRVYSPEQIILAGAGASAASDQFATAIQSLDWDRWASIRNLRVVGVRGPITQAEVLRGGLKDEVRVVGDPALMYAPLEGLSWQGSCSMPNSIGICLGSHTSTRYDPVVVAEAVREAAERYSLQPVVFQLSDSDSTISTKLSGLLGGCRIVRYKGDVKTMMSQIASCRIFLSERLHGFVAGISLGVPSLALSYGSKCDDFIKSLSAEALLVDPGSPASAYEGPIDRLLQDGVDSAILKRRDQLVQELFGVSQELQAWKLSAGSVSSSR